MLHVRKISPVLSMVFLFVLPTLLSAQGVAINGVGSVNRAMGSAGVATGSDSIGALHWNPASISELESGHIDAGLEVVWMNTKLSSSVPTGMSGSEESTSDELYVPSFGFVSQDTGSKLRYGLGAYAIGGFSTDYNVSTSSPISAPPSFGGLGPIGARARIFQIAPTVAYEVSDTFSIGIAPTLTLAEIRMEPYVVGSIQADGTYPTGVEDSTTYGGGFQVGALWSPTNVLSVGASFKSEQWFEDFDYSAMNSAGQRISDSYDFEYPMITSLGVSYTGIPALTLAADVRYFFYGSASGFKEEGYNADGSLRGLGWDDVFAIALGAQYDLTDCMSFRLGYAYNENPISSAVASANIATPLIQQHNLSAGMGFQLRDDLSLSLAAVYVPSESLSGVIQTPLGAIPGSEVGLEIDYVLSVISGLHYQF